LCYNECGDNMEHSKITAVKLIKDKLVGKSFMTYKEIAYVTNYHPKYILKLKREILNGDIALVHGNKNKRSPKAISKEEEEKIVSLYKKSHVSVLKFCRFYGRRSYSCVYQVLKKNGLIISREERKRIIEQIKDQEKN
jgi:hypothetical protein